MCVFLCVFVCERESKRERESRNNQHYFLKISIQITPPTSTFLRKISKKSSHVNNI